MRACNSQELQASQYSQLSPPRILSFSPNHALSHNLQHSRPSNQAISNAVTAGSVTGSSLQPRDMSQWCHVPPPPPPSIYKTYLERSLLVSMGATFSFTYLALRHRTQHTAHRTQHTAHSARQLHVSHTTARGCHTSTTMATTQTTIMAAVRHMHMGLLQ